MESGTVKEWRTARTSVATISHKADGEAVVHMHAGVLNPKAMIWGADAVPLWRKREAGSIGNAVIGQTLRGRRPRGARSRRHYAAV